MIFKRPAQENALDVPDSVPIWKFMLFEDYGRFAMAKSSHPQVCGVTGLSYSIFEVKKRVDYLARALAQELGWHPNLNSEWDKVVGVFSVNTIDYPTLSWAVHRLSGIVSPANAMHSVRELVYQLKDSKAKCLFATAMQLQTSIEAALEVGIPQSRIYLIDSPSVENKIEGKAVVGFKTLNQLIYEGSFLQELDEQIWRGGQSTWQTAYICYSSGTSGIPKGVMISHWNVIANTLQLDAVERRQRRYKSKDPNYTEIVLGLLPQSHIYSLVTIHAAIYRGDSVITLAKYKLPSLLSSIERFKMNVLLLVPPIVIEFSNNTELLAKYDLTSVTELVYGAAPLGAETAQTISKQHPSWKICQAYGITETSGMVSITTSEDIWLGSCGSVLPSIEVRLVTPTGKEVEQYNEPGELLIRSPTVVLGYLSNPDATRKTFRDGWAFQVAPAELEAHILTHPSVADVAVIPVPDEIAGEVPKAYVVKSASALMENRGDDLLRRDIQRYVEQHKARYKWLKGGISFTNAIPKSPTGKILRRMLRNKDKAQLVSSKL